MLRGLYVRVGGRRSAESQKQRKRRNEMDGRFQKIAAKKGQAGQPSRDRERRAASCCLRVGC